MATADYSALVEELRELLAGDTNVRLGLLFGSRATGRARPDSDVDLAVDAPGADLAALGARISERVGAEVDIVPLAAATIPMLEQLIADGVVVYEKNRGAGAAWRSRTLAQLETDRPWYRRMRDAWLAKVAREGLGGG